MAKVGVQRATELTGASKSTIQRAMNAGKLSYEVDANGRRIMDVSELERVFGIRSQSPVNAPSVEQELEKATAMLEMERLKMRIKMLEEQLHTASDMVTDLKSQRDQWQRQASQVLITSQYSQKQAEELREEIKEREKRAREKRAQMESEQKSEQQAEKISGQKVHMLQPRNENDPDKASADESSLDAEDPFNFKGIWKRVKKIGN
jgi:hypothetical protein